MTNYAASNLDERNLEMGSFTNRLWINAFQFVEDYSSCTGIDYFNQIQVIFTAQNHRFMSTHHRKGKTQKRYPPQLHLYLE